MSLKAGSSTLQQTKLDGIVYSSEVKDPRQIWKKLKNLGICSSGRDAPQTFSNEALNTHFGGVASDHSALSVTDFLNSLPADEDYFPLFSFSEVSLDDVHCAIKHSTSQARGHDGIPKVLFLLRFLS